MQRQHSVTDQHHQPVDQQATGEKLHFKENEYLQYNCNIKFELTTHIRLMYLKYTNLILKYI